jgi:hypothetical protein
VLYEVFRLTPPPWTDDFAKAIKGTPVDTTRSRRDIKHVVKNMNLVDNYVSLLLAAFVEADLPSVLVQVITTTQVCAFGFFLPCH